MFLSLLRSVHAVKSSWNGATGLSVKLILFIIAGTPPRSSSNLRACISVGTLNLDG